MCGYKFEEQEARLRQFDRYCAENEVSVTGLTTTTMAKFNDRNPYEALDTRHSRLLLLRQFTDYMNRTGIPVESPPDAGEGVKRPRHEPYIYSTEELRRLFTRIDTWPETPRTHSKRTIIDPLLFRMLYGCGLRIGEALHLTVSDVNPDEGVLRIRNAKNGKDRFVPMADSVAARCRAYSEMVHAHSAPDVIYFPGASGKPYDSSSVYCRFRQYLWEAGISHSGNGPRVHDLRHAFCVHRLRKWVLGGHDLTNLLPYLSAYLGHVDFRGTEYYLRLTVDLYPEIVSRLERAHGYIIPEQGDLHEEF